MLPSQWDIRHSLPFHLSDLAAIVAIYTLWTRNPWGFALLYYWGLTLTSQAFITPVLDLDFPHLKFIMFWISHCLVLWAAVYMTWGWGFRPGWRGYLFTVTVTIGWLLVMLGFNTLAGANYLFVNAKPVGPSLLDLLGEWPWYLFSEVAVGLVLWALITLPWCGLFLVSKKSPPCG